MNAKTTLLLGVTRDLARYEVALTNLRTKMVNFAKNKNVNEILLSGDELNEVLEIAGLPLVNKDDPCAGEQ